MGFFGKKEKPERENISGVTDTEKNPVYPSVTHADTGIDSTLEAQVVKKLDWRVPTLLGFLCASRAIRQVDQSAKSVYRFAGLS